MDILWRKAIATLVAIFILCGGIVVWTPTVTRAAGLTLGDLPVGTLVQDASGFTAPWVVLSHDHFGAGLTTLWLYDPLPAKKAYHSNTTSAKWDTSDIRRWLREEFPKNLSTVFKNNVLTTPAWSADELHDETFFLLSARELVGTDQQTDADIQISGNHGTTIPGIAAYRDRGCPDSGNGCWTRSMRKDSVERAILYWRTLGGGNTPVTMAKNIRPAVSLNPAVPVYGPYAGPEGNYYTLFDADRVQEVIGLIAALPAANDVKLTDGPAITAAKAAYDALPLDQQALIGNAQKLQDVLDAYTARLQSAENVKAEIAALPAAADVTMADEAAIRSARDHYDDLEADQQAVVDNYAKLAAAEAALADLIAAAQAVEDEIAALPDAAAVTVADKPAIQAARQHYNDLNADQRATVTNVDKLEAAEAALAALDAAIAQPVIDQIAALPDAAEVKLTDKADIEAARQAYDELDADQKLLVTNVMSLIEAEQAVAALEADAEAVVLKIAALPDAADVKLADRAAIEAARQAYDELDADQKLLVTNSAKLMEAEQALASLEAVQAVITEIAALPDAADIKLADRAAIEAARQAYDALDADQKLLVTNSAKLIEAEQALADLEADVQAVMTEIAALTDAAAVTLADKPAIQAARQHYNDLHADQRAAVTNVDKLEAAEAALAALDAAAAQPVIDQIAGLPDAADVKLADKATIEAARQAYDELDADQKLLVTNVAKLIAAEQALAELEADVQAVITEIAALPDAAAVTLADKPAIQAARQNYDDLDADQRAAVTNADKLIDVEAALAGLDAAAAAAVEAAIAALPDANDIKLVDKPAIEAARDAYDLLDADQQALVGNVAKLIAAEQALATLERDADAVAAEIAALPDDEDVTLADRDAIRAAREHYDALSADQQALVGNVDRLTEAEAALAALDAAAAQVVEDAIAALPDKADVTEADRAAVEAARQLFDGLHSDQQALVGNVGKLVELERALAPKPSPLPPAPGAPSTVHVLVNGKPTQAGKATASERNGQTVYSVTLASDVLYSRLAAEGDNAVITVPPVPGSDIVVGILTGTMVKDMEQQHAVVEIVTDAATITLPAAQVQIDAVADELGATDALDDIHVHIEVGAVPAADVRVVETAAADMGLALVVPPLNFTVTATYGDKAVEVTEFTAYVERTIAIPDGTDPNRITTAVVAEPDGTFRHVPTVVVEIDGRYYAKVSSLTNSTYAVVWNPVEFPDMADHWARDAVNDLGSRLVVAGIGNGLFDPDRDVTRAEFAAVVVRALGLRPELGDSPYSDVTSADWFAGAVATASRYGLIVGYDGAFRPHDNITREQAMAIIDRARALTDLQLPEEAGPDTLQQFADAAAVSGWARTHLANCLHLGLVKGRSETTLAPQAAMTRAEVATLVRTLLQKAGLI